MTSPEPALWPASGPDRGVHCGTVLLEPARATYSKGVACICASSSTFIRSFHVSIHVQINTRTSNDFRWLPERKESGENRLTSGFELELST